MGSRQSAIFGKGGEIGSKRGEYFRIDCDRRASSYPSHQFWKPLPAEVLQFRLCFCEQPNFSWQKFLAGGAAADESFLDQFRAAAGYITVGIIGERLQ